MPSRIRASDFDFFSTSLREAEQKLTAAVPTGTGPDIFDIGTNISVNFIDNNLIEPNPPDIDAHLKSGLWDKFTVDFFTWTARPMACRSSKAAAPPCTGTRPISRRPV